LKLKRKNEWELDDGIGQQMSATKMSLSSFESNIQSIQPQKLQVFTNIKELVDETIKELRSLSYNMIPMLSSDRV